jgi:hypothetical protein
MGRVLHYPSDGSDHQSGVIIQLLIIFINKNVMSKTSMNEH